MNVRAAWQSPWGFHPAPSGQVAGVPFLWWDDFSLQNIKPSAALDFINGRYYDGSGASTLSALVANNPTVTPGLGMLCNAANFNCQGTLLAALQATSATVIAETSGGASAVAGIVDFTNSGDTPLLTNNGAGLDTVDAFVSAGGHALRSVYSTVNWSIPQRSACSWAPGSITVVARGTPAAANMAFTFAAVTQARLGSYAGSFLFNGYIRRLLVYPAKLSDNSLFLGGSPTPFWLPLKQRAVGFPTASSVLIPNDGHALGFEYTQPWTMLCEVTFVTLLGTANVIFTNVAAGPPWTGYEVFVFPSGKIACRLMSGWDGIAGHSGIIEVQGSTNIGADPLRRIIGVTYNGSGLASGVKIYLDGIPETLTVVENSLSGTIVSGADMWIGNQVGGTLNLNAFTFKNFTLANFERSPGYMAAVISGDTAPANDSNVKLQYLFTEGSGTTVADTSGNGYVGTLAGSPGWV